MGQFFKTLSIVPQGIRRKLTVAFALMSLIPMFVFGYLVFYYIFPAIDTFWDVFPAFVITIFIMFLGFYLARKIIYPIAEIAAVAKDIAEGKVGTKLSISGEDEVGELSGSLNHLSVRLKENMTELHSYGEKIKQINMEINKKVYALSILLQIGNLITTNANLDEVFNLVVRKLAQLETDGAAFLMLPGKDKGCLVVRSQANVDEAKAATYKVKIGRGLLGGIIRHGHSVVVDAKNHPKGMDKELAEILETRNAIMLPVTLSGKVAGVLIAANNSDSFTFSEDEIELIGVFAKQIAVAIENDSLMRKTEELAVRDDLTGLYNESYIRSRLDEEIKRAISYQRPCSLIIIEIANFGQYHNALGDIGTEKILKKISQILKEGTSEIDKIARFSDCQFAVLLPEKNKRQALNIMKNLKEEIERFEAKQNQADPAMSLAIMVAVSSSPIDGTTSIELINNALRVVKNDK